MPPDSDYDKEIPISSQRAVELQNAEELMKGIMIPPRPTVLVDVLNEQSKDDPNLQRIADLISRDVAISAGVLRVVNSSFFGLRRKISSIDHAVRLMGIRSVTNIVTALMLHSAFSDTKGAFMDQFWATSGQLAAVTSHAARVSTAIATEEGYAIGLFANCGVPLMLKKFPNYPSIYSRALEAEDVTASSFEDAELGTDHTLVGFIMGKSWELPETVCQSILRHHDTTDYFETKEDDIADATPSLAVLHLGQFLYRHVQQLPPAHEWAVIGDRVCAYLGISADEKEDLLADAVKLSDESTGLDEMMEG
ncbi:MAG: HDOD domain-containing protein [Rhodothermales bacterium]